MAFINLIKCKHLISYRRCCFSSFTYITYDDDGDNYNNKLSNKSNKNFTNATTLAFESIDPFRRDWTKKAKTKKDRAIRDKRARTRIYGTKGHIQGYGDDEPFDW
mmetsp:Transcript_8075/g.6729  ORF Transcript_8075/g.6729 Transcript_8075/m.6729 type:complete len:105 (+) Transcript_8075:35-349(+)